MADDKYKELEDHPLISELAEKAPGTFEHSQQVASLATKLAGVLDKDVSLLKICALFHDIGKIRIPKFFTENQIPGEESPHDSLPPWASALLITSHISESVVILRNAGFPNEVIDIISQHHGDGLVEYFYKIAGEPDDDDLFRYKHEKPQCLEAGILMICDRIEAAARGSFGIGDNTKDPEEFVRDIWRSMVDSYQLDEADVAIKAQRIILQTLVERIKSVYHSRVDYKEVEKNDTKRKRTKNGETEDP